MWFARLLGLLTVLYSIVALIRPRIMVTPAGLVPREETIPLSLKALTRGIAIRDIAIGVAMMFAPMTVPLVWALGLRIASDFGDAAVFGFATSDPTARLKTIGVAAGWGILNAIALWAVAT
jgi:hypothetical protein